MLLDMGELIDRYVTEKTDYLKNNCPNNTNLVIFNTADYGPSSVYIKNKVKVAEKIGINVFTVNCYLENSDSLGEMINHTSLSEIFGANGVMVQLPLRGGLDKNKVLSGVREWVDVDGMRLGECVRNIDTTYENGRWNTHQLPCTPHGIIMFMDWCGFDLTGKTAVVIGRSDIVGKPLSAMLLKKNATVINCHSKTENLAQYTKMADFIFVACGQPNTLTKDMVKPGAVVFDIGINRDNETGKLCGDCHPNVKEIASVTPVPGGVGRLTTLTLALHTIVSRVADKGKLIYGMHVPFLDNKTS